MQLRRNEILTGLLVLTTVAVLTAVLIVLGAPGLFRPLVIFKVYFDNAAGIKLGAPVLLAGRKIGQVETLFSPVTAEESRRVQQVAESIRPPDPNATPIPANAKPQYQVRIEVRVDKSAVVYKDARARLMSLGLLGDTAIDFTEGNESSGRASDGAVFPGERVPEFGEALARVVTILEPVASAATTTIKELQNTAQNLNHITDENSQLNLALGQFRTLAEHLTTMAAPEGSLAQSLKHIEDLSDQLTKNDNIQVTLRNFRASSEDLKNTLDAIGPDLRATGENVKEMSATLKAQPWRLVWPGTKKYPEDNQQAAAEPASPRRPSPGPRATPKRSR